MNNNLIKNVCKKHIEDIKKVKLTSNSVIFSDYKNNKYVAKENNNIKQLYNYLSSRGFDYLPDILYENDDGYIYKYILSANMPNEQKMSDLIKTAALLHNKTAYYKDVSVDEIKKIYEDLTFKIDDTFNYYDYILSIIENKIYMSPEEYLLARNVSLIFSCLNFCKNELDNWYKSMEDKTKQRIVLLHNNLDTNHILRNDNNILISWNHVTSNFPIYDFIKIYKKEYDNYDFIELFKEYNNIFPLLEEEKQLMFIILFIPKKIIFTNDHILSTLEVGNLCNYLNITNKLFMEQKTKNADIENQNINK